MLFLRKLHLYLGTLFAPAIIFFAVSGMLQVLGLHEAEHADSAQPPAWIVTLASIHKDQQLPRPKTRKPPGALADMRAEHDHPHTHEPAHEPAGAAEGQQDGQPAGADGKPAADAGHWSQTLLKAFSLAMGFGLIVSAGLGIVIAVNNLRTRRVAIVMLAIGLLLPLALLAI